MVKFNSALPKTFLLLHSHLNNVRRNRDIIYSLLLLLIKIIQLPQ